MIVRMLVYFVVVFSMYRLYGEQRPFVKTKCFLHQLQRQVTHHILPKYFYYALVDFDVECMIGCFTKLLC